MRVMISVGGNLYSVPETTRRRILDVHVLADALHIFEAGALIAVHAPLEGRRQRRIDPAHRRADAAVPTPDGHRADRHPSHAAHGERFLWSGLVAV